MLEFLDPHGVNGAFVRDAFVQLRLHLVQMAGQPFTGVLRGFPSHLTALFDEFADQRIGEIRGRFGIG